MEERLIVKSINGNTNFQDVILYVKPPLKENVLIFIKDGEASFDYEKVKSATNDWTILVVSNLNEAKSEIQGKYQFYENTVSTLIFKSHGHAFEGADLDSRHGQGVVHKFSEHVDSSDFFLRKLLKQNSKVMFTACSIIQSFDKSLENPNLNKEQNKRNHDRAKETVENYYIFWIKNTKRKLLLDYTSTSSWNFSNIDNSKDSNGGRTFTDGDKYWFLFNSDFIVPKVKGKYFAGFVWFEDNNGVCVYKPYFYQLQVKSEGGITVHGIKSIKDNKMLPQNEKTKKSL